MMRGVLALAIAAGAVAAAPVRAKPPVVLELYTAQGCASCGEANAHVEALADKSDVLPLTFGVDYWDYLGWKDTFAKPQFAERQRAYDRRFDVAEVFTPQVIVDGRWQTPAVKTADVERLIADAERERPDQPQMRWRGEDRLAVGSGPAPRGGADVWLVRYDPKESTVEVSDGDNRGNKIVERNAVVQLERLGRWGGRPILLKVPPAPADGLRAVALLQGDDGGRILGVLTTDSP